MEIWLVALKLAGADLYESYTGAVVWIHVGMDLEHEAREFGFVGLHGALLRIDGRWARGYLDKAIEQLLDSKGVESRAEKHRRELALTICLYIKLGIDTLDEVEILT